MKKAVLSLDQGTTSSRAILFDRDLATLGKAQHEFAQHFPQTGWVEHDASEIWKTQLLAAEQALEKSGLDVSEVAALGVTNQRETVVLWDRETGEPVERAIVWQDRRSAPLCTELKERGLEELFQEKTGLLLDPYFSGTKIAGWMQDPELKKRASAGELAVGTIDSWLLYNLSAGVLHATDVSNASRTLLYNIHDLAWDHELLEILDVPVGLLPEVRASQSDFGVVSCGSSLDGIPIRALIGDQQAALFGQAAFKKGQAKNTYGTGCFYMLNTGNQVVKSKNKLLSTVAWQLEGDTQATYALEGSVFIGGAVVQWLRDGLGVVGSAQEAQEKAASVEDSEGVFIVPAFSGLGAPYWDPHARGAIFGLSRGSTEAHLCRAAIDSIGYQCAELIACAEADLGEKITSLRVDGGACVNDELMQWQADLLQGEVVRPKVIESTALGAAAMAGLAEGFWKNEQEFASAHQVGATFEALKSAVDIGESMQDWKQAVAATQSLSKS